MSAVLPLPPDGGTEVEMDCSAIVLEKEVMLNPARVSESGALTRRKQSPELEQKTSEPLPTKGGRGRKGTPTQRQARFEPEQNISDNWRLKGGSDAYPLRTTARAGAKHI